MRLEVNMVVSSAREASDYYKNLLKADILSTTDQNQGMNETMMKIGETEIRVLEENKELGMFAPEKVGGGSVWMNIWVDDIDKYFDHIVKEEVHVISPVQEYPGPAKNAVFSDKFNHVWVVNQKY